MKNIAAFVFFLLSLGSFSCRKVLKDVNDYFPSVKTVSATVQPDGSVMVVGEILAEGAAPIQYAGFCTDTAATPSMLAGQGIASVSGNNFSVVYSGFDRYKRYYFRSWAVNEHGYSYGNILYLDDIKADSIIAPCTPVKNTVDYGGGGPVETIFSVDAPAYGAFTWDFQVLANSVTTNFKFGSKPATKIFTTTTSTSPGAGQVYIAFYKGSISAALNDGAPVYVNQTSSTSWEMTICNAPWMYGSSTFYYTTRFVCPL